MRLGLLGPAGEETEKLLSAVTFLRDEQLVDRAVYLGVDGALDAVIQGFAEGLVGGDPKEDAMWTRAADACIEAEPASIDRFIAQERDRRSLSMFESLPTDATRVIELLNGKVTVMIYDKADLDEEDIVAASVLAFGKSPDPVIKKVGARWFLAPGTCGVLVLEDKPDGIYLAQHSAAGEELSVQKLSTARAARLRIQGQK